MKEDIIQDFSAETSLKSIISDLITNYKKKTRNWCQFLQCIVLPKATVISMLKTLM